MCRFLVYQGPPIRLDSLLTEPANSLIHQSFHSHEREEPLNGDGFGVAWWVPELHDDPVVFRSLTPAWSNENLRHLARSTQSRTVMAHVRAASPRSLVAEANTHPFWWRRWAFMHNGDVAGFPRIRRRLVAALSDDAYQLIRGTTDSEHVFALFADRVLAANGDDPTEVMARALAGAVADVVAMTRDAGVDEPSYLNLAVSDGRASAVCRFTTAPDPDHAETLRLHTGRLYTCQDGVCHMLPIGHPGDQAVIVSSEALSEDPGWEMIPPNHLVLLRPDGTTDVRPCTAA